VENNPLLSNNKGGYELYISIFTLVCLLVATLMVGGFLGVLFMALAVAASRENYMKGDDYNETRIDQRI
jgi:hypothetical protein